MTRRILPDFVSNFGQELSTLDFPIEIIKHNRFVTYAKLTVVYQALQDQTNRIAPNRHLEILLEEN